MSYLLENDNKPANAAEDHKSLLVNASFPKKLYELVNSGDEHVVRWEEHGRSFRIIDAEKFAEEILPLYFRHSKLTSFQRQLNLYGFRRITKGEDQGSYYHPKFQRGKPNSVSEIRRLQGKALPNQATVSNTASGVTYGNKGVIQVFDTSIPIVLNADSSSISQFEYSAPLGVQDFDQFDYSLPLNSPHTQLPPASAFLNFDDTPCLSRNVSDFAWCSSGYDGLDDFDPLDISLLDALFDNDVASSS